MRCDYCFYSEVTQLRSQRCGVMTKKTAEAIILKAIATHADVYSVCFQGGEPTLAGVEFFRNFCKNFISSAGSAKCSFSIQTNGTNINEEWIKLFKDYNFLVGLSLDGYESVHDSLRHDLGGNGTFTKVFACAKLLTFNAVPFNILTVITNKNRGKIGEIYKFFRQSGFYYLQFIPCLGSLQTSDESVQKFNEVVQNSDKSVQRCNELVQNSHKTVQRCNVLAQKCDKFGKNDCGQDYSLTENSYEQVMKTIFDFWYDDYVSGMFVSVRNIDNLVSAAVGYPPENCGMSGSCGGYFAVESDGNVYPCDFYCLDEYCIGSVNSADFAFDFGGSVYKKFCKRGTMPLACKTCEYVNLCRGGCRRERESNSTNMRYCAANKNYFAHILPRLNKIAEETKKRLGL